MKTFLYILQINSGFKDIIKFENLNQNKIIDSSNTEISNNKDSSIFLWNNTLNQKEENMIISWNNYFVHFNTNTQNIDYSDNFEFKSIQFQIFFIINSIYYNNCKNINKITSLKYNLINNIIHNIFLSSNLKNKIEEIFYKTQKTYLSLVKFANIIRYKLFKEKNNIDLRLDIIDPKNKYSILLYHYNSKYYFILSDLINIIENSITNSSYMFSNPLFPKNPYNNSSFTESNLYNIYFHIRSVYLVVPFWIQLFFLSDFNLKKFSSKYDQIIREHNIKKYVINTSIDDLYDDILTMISNFYYIFKNIEINEEFPKELLVEIFRPYLFLYIFYKISIRNSDKKEIVYTILRKKLKEFVKYNPQFGRKIINTKLLTTLTSDFNIYNSTSTISTFNFNNNPIHKKHIVNISFNTNHNNFNLKDAYKLLE